MLFIHQQFQDKLRLHTTLQTPTKNYIIPYTAYLHTYNAYSHKHLPPYKAFTYKNYDIPNK